MQTLSYEIDALQVMLPAAMRAKYEKFILVNEPEKIEDEDFRHLLAGRTRVANEGSFESADLLRTLKKYVIEEIVVVDTTIQQQTAVKKVRMIQIAEETTLLQIKEVLHQNAKRQIELIEWMIGRAGQTITAKNIVEETGIQRPVLKALIDRGAASEHYEEIYREPDAPELQDVPIPDQLTEEQEVALQKISKSIKKPET